MCKLPKNHIFNQHFSIEFSLYFPSILVIYFRVLQFTHFLKTTQISSFFNLFQVGVWCSSLGSWNQWWANQSFSWAQCNSCCKHSGNSTYFIKWYLKNTFFFGNDDLVQYLGALLDTSVAIASTFGYSLNLVLKSFGQWHCLPFAAPSSSIVKVRSIFLEV